MTGHRWFAAAFFTLFAVVAVADVNLWPMTGWRLFSTARGPTQAGWEAVVVDAGGQESPVPFDRLGRGFRGALHVLGDFPRLSSEERHAVCRTWAEATVRLRRDVMAVRIYRTTATVSLGAGPPTTRKERNLHSACTP